MSLKDSEGRVLHNIQASIRGLRLQSTRLLAPAGMTDIRVVFSCWWEDDGQLASTAAAAPKSGSIDSRCTFPPKREPSGSKQPSSCTLGPKISIAYLPGALGEGSCNKGPVDLQPDITKASL